MVRCLCKKTDGNQCSRETKEGNRLCWQHIKKCKEEVRSSPVKQKSVSLIKKPK